MSLMHGESRDRVAVSPWNPQASICHYAKSLSLTGRPILIQVDLNISFSSPFGFTFIISILGLCECWWCWWSILLSLGLTFLKLTRRPALIQRHSAQTLRGKWLLRTKIFIKWSSNSVALQHDSALHARTYILTFTVLCDCDSDCTFIGPVACFLQLHLYRPTYRPVWSDLF